MRTGGLVLRHSPWSILWHFGPRDDRDAASSPFLQIISAEGGCAWRSIMVLFFFGAVRGTRGKGGGSRTPAWFSLFLFEITAAVLSCGDNKRDLFFCGFLFHLSIIAGDALICVG